MVGIPFPASGRRPASTRRTARHGGVWRRRASGRSPRSPTSRECSPTARGATECRPTLGRRCGDHDPAATRRRGRRGRRGRLPRTAVLAGLLSQLVEEIATSRELELGEPYLRRCARGESLLDDFVDAARPSGSSWTASAARSGRSSKPVTSGPHARRSLLSGPSCLRGIPLPLTQITRELGASVTDDRPALRRRERELGRKDGITCTNAFAYRASADLTSAMEAPMSRASLQKGRARPSDRPSRMPLRGFAALGPVGPFLDCAEAARGYAARRG